MILFIYSGSIRIPFAIPLTNEQFRWCSSYSGTSFAIRHLLRVVVHLPWYCCWNVQKFLPLYFHSKELQSVNSLKTGMLLCEGYCDQS